MKNIPKQLWLVVALFFIILIININNPDNTSVRNLASADNAIGSTSRKLILSGATAFISDNDGSFNYNIGSDYWDTLGGNQAANLWITPGVPLGKPDGLKTKFINGPIDTKAKISIKLSPGTHKFTVYGNDGTPIYYHGLNLFFDDDSKNPRISVYAPTRTILENIPPFSPNSSTHTIALDSNIYTIAPGAGTTVYNNGKFTVKLREFFFAGPDVFQTDRTKSLPENPGNTNLLVPDGKREFIGSFTLEVTRNKK